MTEEDFRGGVHFTAGALFAIMAAYNLMRLVSTESRRHAINVGINSPLVCFEAYQTWRHWRHE